MRPAVPIAHTGRAMRAAVLWLSIYLALVLAPLLLMLVSSPPPGLGRWWDTSAALGFAGLSMMAVQFLLTARFRRATAPFGIDIIYYFHRHLGTVILLIVLAHPVLLIVDNPALIDWLNPALAPWHMTAGVLAVVALLALMVSSLWRKRIGLSYERWRISHLLLSIAAVGLALVHIDGVGYYTADPATRGLWIVIAASWIAVGGYVRVIRPWQVTRRPYRVDRLTHERGDAWTLSLAPHGHDGIAFQPGQFAWLTIGGSPFAMREHPFSFSSSAHDNGGRVACTIKELGDFTSTIGRVRPGDTAYVDAPYGAFTIDRHVSAGFVFIAGGIGIAPLMSMLRTMADRRDTRPVLLLYGYRTWDRVTFREEIQELESRLNLVFVPVLEEPPTDWTGERGRITADLLDRRLPPQRLDRHYFICGPEAMTQTMERRLHGLGIPLSRIHSELFELV